MTDIQSMINYRFLRQGLLKQALTHSSYGFEQQVPHNERLEFLGDALLDFVIAEELFRRHPTATEGDLSKQKSALVSTVSLAKKARELGLGHELVLGVGESKTGGHNKSSILADALESLIAAVFLDGGMGPTHSFITSLFQQELQEEQLKLKDQQDFKTMLQERLQARNMPLPEYKVLAELGPAHRREYNMQVRVGSYRGPSAIGSSKKNAQQVCARLMLEQTDFWSPEHQKE